MMSPEIRRAYESKFHGVKFGTFEYSDKIFGIKVFSYDGLWTTLLTGTESDMNEKFAELESFFKNAEVAGLNVPTLVFQMKEAFPKVRGYVD